MNGMKYFFSILAAKSDKNNREKWLPFFMHSMDTAGVMEMLFEQWLPNSSKTAIAKSIPFDNLKRFCIFLGMVHDIGKLTSAFQKRIGKQIPDYLERLQNEHFINSTNIDDIAFSHAYAGQTILLKNKINGGVEIIVGSHHGKPIDTAFDVEIELGRNWKNYYDDRKLKDKWSLLWKEWIAYSLRFAEYQDISELPQLDMKGQMILTGMLIMADWIASNTDYFPLIDLDENIPIDMRMRAQNGWEQAWSNCLPQPWISAYDYVSDDVFESKFGFAPNIVQKTIIEAVNQSTQPGLYILEAQMGVGKTEAALAAAEMLASRCQCGGLYFGLPTQATSNGIFGRLCAWAEQQGQESYALYSVKLAHGNAILNEDYRKLFPGNAQVGDYDEIDMGITACEWFEGNKKALLANFVIGTVDQLLMTSLKQKHVMLRHLGLSGKVSIIDECHAYDTYMSQYLDRTLSWLGAYHVPVIILSATLPAKRRAELVDAYQNCCQPSENGGWRTNCSYPLLTWTDGSNVHQTEIVWDRPDRSVEMIRNDSEDIREIAAFLSEKLQEGGCAGIIVNTVKKSQEYAEQFCKELSDDFTIDLFHSQFIMPDRNEREAELMKNVGKDSNEATRYKRIVIGTQVLEQSLDLDFDIMATELCPMDLLLQRIGRLHRHQRIRPRGLENATCIVLNTKQLDKDSQKIYGEWLLMRTTDLLPESITLPDDIATLVQDTYSLPDEPMDEEHVRAWKAYEERMEDKRKRAQKYRMIEPEEADEEFPEACSIEGLLDIDIDSDLSELTERGKQKAIEAKVRDIDASVDIIVMMRYNNGRIHFLPWQNEGIAVPVDEVPWGELEKRIASQKLRLPRKLCAEYSISKTIKTLEQMTNEVSMWQGAHLLKGELFLLLDENFKAEISEYSLQYDKNIGLRCDKRGNRSEK